jgi:protoporphyrinogen oxidase
MIVIIGAGVSGLTAARELAGKKDFILLEKENYRGGLSTQYEVGGYRFDFGGHYFHFQDKADIQTIVEGICAFKKFNRKSKTFALERLIPFPIQFHLSYLPEVVREQITAEIMAADFTPASNLHDFLEINFGKTLFQLFFQPFLSKYYQIDLHEIIANMDRGSIPPPDKERIAAGAAGKKFYHTGYNPVFYYPASSLTHFIKNYSASITATAMAGNASIHLQEEVIGIDAGKRRVKTAANEYVYDKLVTSMPLNKLVEMIQPAGLFPSPGEFNHISTLLVNVILKRKRKQFHWVYLADKNIPFYRVGFYPVHPYPACYLEKTVSRDTTIDKEELREEIVMTLKALQLIEESDEVVFFDARVIPVSYILFTTNWPHVVPLTIDKLKKYGIYSIGRYGSWNYTSMSEDIKGAISCIKELEV